MRGMQLSDDELVPLIQRAEGLAGRATGQDRGADFTRSVIAGALLVFFVSDAESNAREGALDAFHDEAMAGREQDDAPGLVITTAHLHTICDSVSDHSTKRELMDALVAIKAALPPAGE